MTSDAINAELHKREILGKGLNKLRNDGEVPAVIHNHGKPSVHVKGDLIKLTKVYSAAGRHHPVNLTIDGKKQLAMIKDADFEPTKHKLRHLVFQAIKQNEKVTTDVPVVLTGEEIPAERAALLVLTHHDVVEIEALPGNLPDQLEIDATSLTEVGDRLHASDIKLPEGVELLTDPETVIATVEMPKDQLAEADAAAADLADDAGTETEVPSEHGEEVPAEEKAEPEVQQSQDEPQ